MSVQNHNFSQCLLLGIAGTNCEHLNSPTKIAIPTKILKYGVLLTHLALDKKAIISQTTYSNAFSWMKIFKFQINFIEICSLGSNWWYVSTGSDNGFEPFRQQATIWTNADPVHQSIYAALGGDELVPGSTKIIQFSLSKLFNRFRILLFTLILWYPFCEAKPTCLVLCGTHLRPILQEVLKISFHKMILKNILVQLLPHFPGASELKALDTSNFLNWSSPPIDKTIWLPFLLIHRTNCPTDFWFWLVWLVISFTNKMNENCFNYVLFA